MNNQRIAIIIMAGMGLLGTFLYWAGTGEAAEIQGIHYIGWITLILFLIPAALAFIGNRGKLLKGTFLYVAIIAALSASAIGLWEIFKLRPDRAAADYGLYLVVLGGVMILLAAFIVGKKEGTIRRSDSKKSGAYSHKTEVSKKAGPD